MQDQPSLAQKSRQNYLEALDDRASDLRIAASQLAIDARFYTVTERSEIEAHLQAVRESTDVFERLLRQEL